MDRLNFNNFCDIKAKSLSVTMQVVYYNNATDITLDIYKSGYFSNFFLPLRDKTFLFSISNSQNDFYQFI